MDQLADWDLGEDFDDDNDWHPPGELPSSSSDDEDEQEARDSTVASLSLSNKWTRRRFFGKPMPTLISESTEEVLTPSEYFDRYFTEEIYELLVLTTSTAIGAQPLHKVQRYDIITKSYIEVTCPDMIKNTTNTWEV
ncbi:unnamed protein product [Parnassius apollo]|uniref:(apollo) hypothetical protein n=1 Tax=Parnassius apollo TaxID=110799 RepID=A0A8S3W1H9_PARAO|nr:unnamed protein product [Parnassius apollo]